MSFKKMLLYISCFSLLNSCAGSQQSFSQFPGFTEYFNVHVPADSLPTAAEQELLEKYRPRVFLATGQRGPVDFYNDYIAHGELSVDGSVVSKQVTQELLNKYREHPNAQFKYTGDYRQAGTPVVFGRIDRERVSYGANEHEWMFLTYSLVFPVSGILKGLGGLPSFGLSVVADLDDWHQLDHYTSATIAVFNGQPVAMSLQQHNYQTSYLLDPSNPDIAVDIAKRSNELYPHSESVQRHPAVSFLSPDNIEFVVEGTNKPFAGGFDITHGETELSYALKFLPPSDAFYQFKGRLGVNRLLPGRSGPPGAGYATLPGLMPRSARLATGYRSSDAQVERALLEQLIDLENFVVLKDGIKPFYDRLLQRLER